MLPGQTPLAVSPIASQQPGTVGASAVLAGSGEGACALAITRQAAGMLVGMGLATCLLAGPPASAAATLTGSGQGACALTATATWNAAATLTGAGDGACTLTTPFPRGSFTAALIAEKNLNDGVAPTCVLWFDFVTEKLFVGAHAQTIAAWDGADRTVKGWVFSFGRFDDVVRLDLSTTPVLAGDATMRFWCPGGEDGADSLWTRLIDPRNRPEKTVVRFYRWWRTHLSAATDPPVCRWEGAIKDWKWESEDTLAVTFGDATERLDKLVGTVATRDLWPNIDPDDLGKIEPIVYGDVPYVPALAANAGPNSTLAFDQTATQTHAYYSDTGTTFATNGTIFIGNEECAYVGKTTEVIGGVTFGKLTNLSRGANGTTAVAHKKGATLYQKQAAYLYLIAGHPCFAVPELYLEDVTGDLVLIDPTSYAIALNNAGKTTATFTAPPRLVRGGDITGVTDTIGVSSDAKNLNVSQASDAIADNTAFLNTSGATAPGGQFNSAVAGSAAPTLYTFAFETFTFTFGGGTTNLSFFAKIAGQKIEFYRFTGANNPFPAGATFTVTNSTSAAGGGIAVEFGADNFGTGTFAWTFKLKSLNRIAQVAAVVTKTGTVTLIGNSAADVFVGGRIFARVQGYKDDALGTYTGTPNALIQNTRDVIKHFCVTQMGYAPSDVTTADNLAAKMGGTYQCHGAILEQGRARVIRARMAFESACWVKDAAGLVTLIFRERFFQPSHVLSTPRLVFLDGDRKTVDRDRLKTYETINRADVRYARDYTQIEGEGAYLSFVRKEDLSAQDRYGLQENPQNLRCNWIRTDAHAAAFAQFIVDVYGPRRPKVKVSTLLHHMDVAFGDRVRVQDRMQKYLPGEVLSVDHQPEHAINGQMPVYDFTILGIEEAEAMLGVKDITAAAYTLTAQDQHLALRNKGAAGTVTLTAPAALVTNNQVMRFGPIYVHDAQAFRFKPAGTDKLVLTFTSGSATDKTAPATQTAGKYIGSSTKRARLYVQCDEDGEWTAWCFGAWAMEP